MSDPEIPQVGPVDPTKRTSEIDPDGGNAAVLLDGPPSICLYNGVEFTQGAQVCVGNKRLQCGSQGKWFPYGTC
jgi:hypothetical protein